MTKGELKLVSIFLGEFADYLGEQGCNDLPKHIINKLSGEEWDNFNKEYHDYNGDPEEYSKGRILPDFAVVDLLSVKVKKLLEE